MSGLFKDLTGQSLFLTGHCPLTGRYLKFYLSQVSKFVVAAVCERDDSWVEIKYIFKNPTTKTDIPTFLSFCENNFHQITYLPKSYLWTKKMKEIDFLTPET